MDKTMIDTHSHLIPGVDDGALDPDMAACMLLQAYDQGIRTVFATPHSGAFHVDAAAVSEGFRRLRERAAFLLPDLRIFMGCEVLCDSSHMDAVLRRLDSGQYPTMNGTDYVLTEFSQWVDGEQALKCVKALTQVGWKPILAHLERYEKLGFDLETADQFRQLGCLIQINAYSLQEEPKETIKAWARELVQRGWVTFLGTDAHRTYHRPPCAKSGLDWLYDNCSRDYADGVARENARRLLCTPAEP